MTVETVEALKSASSTKIISFDEAQIVPGIIPETFFLIVKGTAPCANMKVELSPLIYIRKPEYWGIEVIGSLPGGICLTAIKPFLLSIPLTGITGTKGIEVIGANKQEKFDI